MGRPAGSKNKQVAEIKNTAVLETVKDLTHDKLAAKIASVGVEVQNQLAALTPKVTEQLSILKDIEGAIAIKRDELKTLYSIETETTTFDEIVALNEQRKSDMNEEFTRIQKQYNDIANQRELDRKRDEEAYQYKLAQDHQKQQDMFTAKMAEQEKQNKNKQEALEKSWAERSAVLAAAEKELGELRTLAANMPNVIKAETDKVSKIITAQLTNQFTTEKTLAAKDAEIQLTSAKQLVLSRDESIARLNEQLATLKSQLDQAHKDVKEISAKALEASSSRDALANLQKAFENVQGSRNSK